MEDDAIACGLRCFTGRTPELATLRRELERAVQQRQPRFVLVEGDYGTGKTTLVERFLIEATRAQSKLVVLRGRCAEASEGDGRLPFRQALGGLAAVSIARPALRAAWEYLHNVGPEWLDFVTLGLASPIVHTADELYRHLGSRASRLPEEGVFGQFANALSRAAERRPVILFIDDLHWADESSLRLLLFLRQHLEHAPILIVAAYRPVEARHTGQHTAVFGEVVDNLLRQGAEPIELKQGLDVPGYLARRYGDLAWPPELVARIAALSGGQPLFLYELPTLWETQGLLVATPDAGWQLAAMPDLDAPWPSGVDALLDLRLQQIGQRLEDLLKRGAVEGDEFPVQVVRALSGLDEEQVLQDLAALEQRFRLLRSDELGDQTTPEFDFCRFVHGFYREYVYHQRLTPALRRRYHRQAAECLERLHPQPGRIADRLARHWSEARDYPRAAHYALLAARGQRERGAWAEVERWCADGLRWLESDLTPERQALRLDLLQESAEGRHFSGQGLAARERYTDALALAQQLHISAQRVGLLGARLAEMCDDEDDYDAAWECVHAGQAALQAESAPLSEAHIHLAAMEGLLHTRFGRFEQALAVLGQGLDQAATLPPSASLATARAGLHHGTGLALGYMGRFPEALDAYEHAAQAADEVGDVYTALWSRVVLGEDAFNAGQFERAETNLEHVLREARRNGICDVEGYALTVRAELHIKQDRPLDALEDLAAALPLQEQAGFSIHIAYADQAMAYLALGELDLAHSLAQQALDADAGEAPRQHAYALHALGQVETAQGQYDAALQHLEQATEGYRAHGEPDSAAQVQRAWALALAAAGQRERARAVAEEARATFQRLGLAHQVRTTEAALAKIG